MYVPSTSTAKPQIGKKNSFTDFSLTLLLACPADPAFGKNKVECDFRKGECKAFHDLDGTTVTYDDSMGAVFSVDRATHAPTVRTDNYIFFGRIDVEIQAAPEGGIVTSAVLQSDDLDEIDWEWVGGDNTQVQSNYFSKGDDSTFDRGGFHDVDSPITQFHMYTIDWTPEAIQWIINGKTVRTLKAADVGDKYPQSPMQIRLGAWTAGREGAPEGTIEWSGGIADFSKGPFNAYYKSISIVDYAGGSSATSKDVKEYVFGDRSGSADSIQIKLNDGSSADKDVKTSSKASEKTAEKTAEKTTTKSESKTSAAAVTTTAETSQAETTLTTASSTSADITPTGGNATTAPTTGSTTSPTPIEGAAPRTGMAFGGVIAAAVVVAASQLL